jgi:hypothetical protein
MATATGRGVPPLATVVCVVALAMTVTLPARVAGPTTIDADEARSIATDAYVYLYAIVTMHVTHKQLTNMPEGKGGGGPMNQFVSIRTYPPADLRVVVRPNFDALYSSAWLDLTTEPLVLSPPDTDGRYYLMPMLDMWTDAFASPGWRTTGTAKSHFLIAPADWRPDVQGTLGDLGLPAGTQRIDAPTPFVWIIGRTKTDGPSDYPAVNKIQDGFKLTPLSQWGKDYQPPAYQPDPSVDVTTPPKTTVDNMSGEPFFSYAAGLLKTNPPHLTDQPIIARLARPGFVDGQDLDVASLDASVRDAIAAAPSEAQALMKWKLPTLARVVDGWSMNIESMGVYGNFYLKRAIVAQQGLGANVPEDAIYPLNLADSTGQPLDGTHDYTLHFDRSALPPVDAFWSITLYDNDGFQVGNPLDRFAVSSWMPLVYTADGSLDLHFQNESPGKDREANWLPAPKGPFNLTMRLYPPQAPALTGKWSPLAVVKTVPSGLAVS